jgi:hypothetical protein
MYIGIYFSATLNYVFPVIGHVRLDNRLLRYITLHSLDPTLEITVGYEMYDINTAFWCLHIMQLSENV